jgi:hypothetical protein
MGDHFFIRNKNGNVIDIDKTSNKLDAFTKKPTDNDNQLWEFVADPGGSGYFFIKNKNGNVISLVTETNSFNVSPQKSPGTVQANDNQLWLFLKDPQGSDHHFIISKLNAQVIDIQHGSDHPGTPLVSFPMKPSNNDNQLWNVDEGSFPSSVSAASAPSSGLGSNRNYKMFSNCNPLSGITIFIDVTQDILCQSNSGQWNGFSFQLNCYSPLNHQLAYQQFVLGLMGNPVPSIQYNVQGGVNSGSPLFNVGVSSLGLDGLIKIPAGYQLMIGFNTESTLVSRAGFAVKDNNGNIVAQKDPILMSSIDGVGPPSVGSAPVVAFELNLVGPVSGEAAVLSWGAGTITYLTNPGNQNLLPSSQFPPCADTRGVTLETANSVYGFLPAHPNNIFKQSFNVKAPR